MNHKRHRDYTIPALLVFALSLAIGFAILLISPSPAEGHEPVFDVAETCDEYRVIIDLIADVDDPQDHRVFVVQDNIVLDTRDIIGSSSDKLSYLVAGGTLPVESHFEVWVFDEVEGDFVYDPDLGDVFDPNISIGDLGLHAYDSRAVREDNTCPTAPEPTETPEPAATPVVTATPTPAVDACPNLEGLQVAVPPGFESRFGACLPPEAAPQPAGSLTGITPPSTGNAGIIK